MFSFELIELVIEKAVRLVRLKQFVTDGGESVAPTCVVATYEVLEQSWVDLVVAHECSLSRLRRRLRAQYVGVHAWTEASPLRELAPDADITFERIAVTPEQITAWALPTRPTKPSDTRSKNFGEISVELDAIDPNQLRTLVQETIELHLPPEQFEILKAAEESERDVITRLVGKKIAGKRLR